MTLAFHAQQGDVYSIFHLFQELKMASQEDTPRTLIQGLVGNLPEQDDTVELRFHPPRQPVSQRGSRRQAQKKQRSLSGDTPRTLVKFIYLQCIYQALITVDTRVNYIFI